MDNKVQPDSQVNPLQKTSALFATGVFSKLIPELQNALADIGYKEPTPVQEKTIPLLLDSRDLLGSAQTGTGKTAAFILPVLQQLTLQKKSSLPGKPRVIIIVPTRELAVQIGENIRLYGRYLHISYAVIFGGIKQYSQVELLKNGKHIVVATPGRLLDLLHQNHINLEGIDTFILDEADRMLDMGFFPDISKIIDKLPAKRQTIFFSATISTDIMKLARLLLKNPIEIAISPDITVVEQIEQTVCFVDKADKLKLLVDILSKENMRKVLVFTRMKHVADRLSIKLNESGITSEAIHSDKEQNTRIRSLDSFKSERVRVLVATDIAARGIDIDNISHVVNYDLPREPQTYVHRIGRTARAGAKGDAVSFCSAEEREYLHKIEKFINKPIYVMTDHKYHSDQARLATGTAARPAPKKLPERIQSEKNRMQLSRKIAYSEGKKKRRKR